MGGGRIHLETERLIVRQYEERDVADILDYSRHDESDEHRRRIASSGFIAAIGVHH